MIRSRRQPHPGTYIYRSPTGYVFLVTNHGTLNLGRNPFAHQVWNAAQTRMDTAAA